jgi:para-nitrobenzyl esterase
MKRVAQAVTLALMCATGVLLVSQAARTQGASCFVGTIDGTIQGLDRGSSCAFLGIPFAAPPTGNLRWRRPQPAPAWAPSTFNAVTAPVCAQISAASGQPTGVENCLTLNIWTPNPLPAAGAPVIVWIHGGGFANASANFAAQNGQNLAALTGAIIVAPNYRLGPFGFLRHDALAAEDSAAGNYGLLDQRAALVWVRDHIAAFGGNPANVTIAGQSAGAHSVSLHMIMHGSAGLFHRAVMQSGTMSFRVRTATDAQQQAVEFATALGCTGSDTTVVLTCLRSKGQNEVLAARPPSLSEAFTETGRTQWTPIVDGVEISDQPRYLYERGQFNPVPVLLGTNRDEGWTFVNRSFPATVTADQYERALETEFGVEASAIRAQYPPSAFASPKDALARLVGDAEYVCEANRVARLIERTKTPVFLYSLEYELDPVVLDRVVHGLDVNLVFGNNYGPPLFASYSLGAADLALFHTMAGYWTRFADRGNPNSDDPAVVHWPSFTHPTGQGRGSDKYLTFDATIREGKRQREAQCDFWEPFFLRSITGAVPAFAP